jgi:EmrB/QacA subfamily drug resistance transporter
VKPPCDEAQIRSLPAEHPCSEAAAPWILTAVILGSSLAFIDSTVVNVALPALQANFGASVVDVQWVVEGYALFLAALILVGGSLGDLFGRRRVFLAGVSLFAASSVWCGLSRSIHELILARCVQGIGAALLVPGSLAIISASFGQKRRGSAIGTWSGATAMTTAIGPVLGGWLIQHASWRWAFFINLPLAVAVVVISWWRVPETKSPDATTLDWAGSCLVTLGLAGVVYGLIEAPRFGWGSVRVIASLVLGVLALLAFLFVEGREKSPMVPLSLFRSRTFAGANLLTLFLYAAVGAFFFLFPLNLIQVQHYSATAAGAAALPMILLLFFLSRWSGGLVARFGARVPLVAGPLVVAVGFTLFTIPFIGGTYWRSFFVPFVVLGFGMAVSIAPLTTVVMNALPPDRAGVASGVNNAVARIAGLLAVAVLGIVALHAFRSTLSRQPIVNEVSPGIRQELLADSIDLAATQIPDAADPRQVPQLREAMSASFISAFRLLIWICAALSVLSALVAARWMANPAPPKPAQPHVFGSPGDAPK